MSMRAELLLQRLDKDFKLLEEIRQPSRSFVKAFIGILAVLHANVAAYVTDIVGAAASVNALANGSNYHLVMAALPGEGGFALGGAPATNNNGELWGIQVGSNNTAATANDIAMNTRIVHGSAGLYYGGSEVEVPVVAAPNVTMLLRRYFTNKSGGDITVRETGIYSPCLVGGVGNLSLFCICRDGGLAVVVHDTELLRVQYTIQTTV